MGGIRNLVASLAIIIAGGHPAAGNGIELPTMGWSSWNTYRVNISDSLICRQADAMIALGLDKAGYRYINIDDGYFGGRDAASGRLLIHPERFPKGLKPVVDHIHGLGLKAGIYSDAGANTCGCYWDNDTIARNVGLLGHEEQDARFFFDEIGFDFIKVDYCGADGLQNSQRIYLEPEARYEKIRRAIDSTHRGGEVRMNVCRWAYPGTWVRDVASSWRTTSDINCSWESVKSIIAHNLYLSAYAGNGRYNDMDMLEVGRGLSPEEDRTHFGMWCMMASPLLIGCDLTTLKPSTIELITNPELIAINQDTCGIQPYVVKTDGETYMLVRDIEEPHGTTRAIAFYNPTDSVVEMSVKPADIELGGHVTLRDAMNRCDAGTVDSDSIFRTVVAPHGVGIFTAKADRRLTRRIYEAENAWLTSYQEIYDPLAVATAFYSPNQLASGYMVATNLGNRPSNDLIWPDVYVPDDSTYQAGLVTFGDAPAEILVQVNDHPAQLVKTAASPDGLSAVTTPLRLPLDKGSNRVRLASRGAMPDIDCLIIDAR